MVHGTCEYEFVGSSFRVLHAEMRAGIAGTFEARRPSHE